MAPQDLYLRQMEIGPMANFVYLIGPAGAPETAVVDAAWDIEAILRAAEADGRRVVAALVTHWHPDHTNGLERLVESGARALADQFHDELAGLVTGTIQRWDAAQTSSQLELLLGRDLQYIRINGTVVGAGVGLVLHAVALGLA